LLQDAKAAIAAQQAAREAEQRTWQAETAALDEARAAASSDVCRLQGEISRLEAELAAVQEASSTSSSVAASSLADLRQQLGRVHTQLAAGVARNLELEQQLEIETSTAREARKALDASKYSSTQALEAVHAALKQQQAAQETGAAQWDEERTALQRQCKEARQRQCTTENQIAQLKMGIAAANDRVTVSESASAQQMQLLSADLKQARADCQIGTTRVQQLEAQLAAHTQEAGGVVATLKMEQVECLRLQQLLDEALAAADAVEDDRTSERKAWRVERATLEFARAGAAAQLGALRDKISSLARALAEAREHINSVQGDSEGGSEVDALSVTATQPSVRDEALSGMFASTFAGGCGTASALYAHSTCPQVQNDGSMLLPLEARPGRLPSNQGSRAGSRMSRAVSWRDTPALLLQNTPEPELVNLIPDVLPDTRRTSRRADRSSRNLQASTARAGSHVSADDHKVMQAHDSTSVGPEAVNKEAEMLRSRVLRLSESILSQPGRQSRICTVHAAAPRSSMTIPVSTGNEPVFPPGSRDRSLDRVRELASRLLAAEHSFAATPVASDAGRHQSQPGATARTPSPQLVAAQVRSQPCCF
jgi:hypothetical protein